MKEVLDNALQGRETANFEFPLYTKDRQRVEVLLNATTRRDVSGAVVGMIGVGQDITERKQVEVEKTRVAQELQTFIDTANAPIFGIDARGLVNEWNNKAAAITGFSREEVLGKNLVQVLVHIIFFHVLAICFSSLIAVYKVTPVHISAFFSFFSANFISPLIPIYNVTSLLFSFCFGDLLFLLSFPTTKSHRSISSDFILIFFL